MECTLVGVDEDGKTRRARSGPLIYLAKSTPRPIHIPFLPVSACTHLCSHTCPADSELIPQRSTSDKSQKSHTPRSEECKKSPSVQKRARFAALSLCPPSATCFPSSLPEFKLWNRSLGSHFLFSSCSSLKWPCCTPPTRLRPASSALARRCETHGVT